ncbi:MAG: hypothetical protein JST84_04775 [Acidobacteria bacterium]|nr:hypothetical protein [Acidobacteriota bacterium]
MEFEVISRYTRKQAIKDGVLIPIHDNRLKYPAVITDNLSAEVVDKTALVTQFIITVRSQESDGQYLRFQHEEQTIWAYVGPDDDLRPCLTFGFPSDF